MEKFEGFPGFKVPEVPDDDPKMEQYKPENGTAWRPNVGDYPERAWRRERELFPPT